MSDERVEVAAAAIHDRRCLPLPLHKPGEVDDCARFYADHAEAAIEGLEEAGFYVGRLEESALWNSDGSLWGTLFRKVEP